VYVDALNEDQKKTLMLSGKTAHFAPLARSFSDCSATGWAELSPYRHVELCQYLVSAQFLPTGSLFYTPIDCTCRPRASLSS